MEARSRAVVNCPHCGVENPATEARCGTCSRGLTLYIGQARALPRKFGLGSLMVLVAIIAVGLGIFRVVPVLGMLVLYLSTPAMIRTLSVISQRADDQRHVTREEKSLVFVSSIGLMIAVLVASFIAFMAVGVAMSTIVRSMDGLAVAFCVSVAVGVIVGFLILRKFWPYCE